MIIQYLIEVTIYCVFELKGNFETVYFFK